MSARTGEQDCLIVGASARAAVSSAVAAGLRVVTADLFADRDTQAMAEHCIRVFEYPEGFASIREEHRTLPVVYTGALENHPRLLTEFEHFGPLWGNPASVVCRVRDPLELVRAFQGQSIASPRVILPTEAVSAKEKGRWLIKARRSAGGQQVRLDTNSTSMADDCYLQEFICGEVCSGSFVACDGEATLLGVSEMLVGEPWLGATAFTYCGSITRRPSSVERRQWQRIGQCLAAEFGLLGLFGVDAVIREREVFPIEVNPRYTSSMELLDRAGMPVFRSHVRACANRDLAEASGSRHHNGNAACFGKAIVYAREACCIPAKLPVLTNEETMLADIPQIGERISVGQPVLSLITRGQTSANVRAQLRSSSVEIYDWLARLVASTTR